jgi:hypothetical protein
LPFDFLWYIIGPRRLCSPCDSVEQRCGDQEQNSGSAKAGSETEEREQSTRQRGPEDAADLLGTLGQGVRRVQTVAID